MKSKRSTFSSAIAAMALCAGLVTPAWAGPAEIDLLSSYVGNWNGSGVLSGGANPEPFNCRMKVAKGNQAKVNYSGRCSLVNMNLSVSGTIAYDDSARRYLAAMSSNVGFTGQAVGVKQGSKIVFDLAERSIDRGGNNVRIGSRIELVGEVITVNFEVEFNNSGEVLTAKVPFNR